MVLVKQQSVRPSQAWLKSMAIAGFLGLASCGGDGSETTTDSGTTPITVTGTAEAPQGVIAQLEYNKSFVVAAIEYTFPAAYAGITGLQPVTGATVALIRIDDDGVQVGAVLATTTTSITGDYSLALPTGVSLAGNLIVRITGNSGASMSAMVVDQAVDINPISQFVLDKFVDDDNLILADLAVNEVVALSGRVAEFDLTVTSDISSMLALLEAEVGQFVDNEIAIIESTPDDGAAVSAAAGKWHTVEFGVGMHDNEAADFGTFALNVLSEELVFAASSGADHNLSISIGPLLLDTFTNFSVDSFGNTNLYHEINLTGDIGDSFPVTIDADGNISLSFPFEEDLQTVDTLTDPDGPDFGWRYPPGTEIFNPVMGGNMYVTIFNDAGVRYETTDTNGDGVKDAIDPAKKSGDEVEFDLSLFIKEGSGMDVNSIAGDFGGVFLNINVGNATTPTAVFDSTVGVLDFSGGTATRAVNAFDVREITRTPATPPAVTLAQVQSTEPASIETFLYTVSATGKVMFDFGGGDILEGYVSSDGSVIAIVDDESTGSPVVTNVNNEMLVLVKLGSAMTAALDGASYRLHVLGLNASASGATEIFTLGNGVATFNADASSVTINGVDRGVMRSTDIAAVEALTAETVNETFTIDSLAANGAVTMTGTDTSNGIFTTTLKGFVSADSKLLILRLYGEDSVSGVDYDLGMVIGVKQ